MERLLDILYYLNYFPETIPKPLSSQQFVDCTVGRTQGMGTEMVRSNKGCSSEGSFPDVHLHYVNYVNESGGLQTSDEYRYTAKDEPCREKVLQDGRAIVSNHSWQYFADEDDLMEMIQYGPVATNIDVTEAFRDYNGVGVFVGDGCDNYEEEDIPPACQKGEGYTCFGDCKDKLIKQRKGEGYTCLGDCKYKLPKHCDR